MKITLPAYVIKALALLKGKGFFAFAVGGCIRDSILGKTPNDWDLCTSAIPEEICNVFAEYKTVGTGLVHGTVTVFIDSQSLEITTFRRDGIYLDHRRPDSVSFSEDLLEDLKRRDFTINAMAYNEVDGLVDAFGGMDDIKDKCIRCVGNPFKRFSEDSLRIIRAARFASTLGCSIDKATACAMEKLAPTLSFTSPERKCGELKKLLMGKDAGRIIAENAEVIFSIIPDLRKTCGCKQENPYHFKDVFSHTLLALDAADGNLNVKLAALLHDIGKPICKTLDDRGIAHFYGHAKISTAIAEDVLNNLRFQKSITKRVCELIYRHDEPMPMTPKKIKKILAELGREGFLELIALKRADLLGQAPDLIPDRLTFFTETLLEYERIKNECFTLSQLAINGNDLLAIGFKRDKFLGALLAKLLDAVISDEVNNDKAALIEFAKRIAL